jgi:hypothetical protein
MTQQSLDIGPTDLGIRRCVECGTPYREQGFTELPLYTLNRLLKRESPEPTGVCAECKERSREQ